jgi:AcrR family transcriptional regulator
MRDVSAALGVVPMALYRHVRNKDDLVDGIVDLVFLEIPLPVGAGGWKTAMRDRSVALHEALLRHRWAVGLMESRLNPGPATLRHHDAVLGCLRAAGFSLDETAHVYSLIDSYVYGFAQTQLTLPFSTPDDVVDVAQAMLAPFPAGTYPHLAEFITDHAMQPGYAYANEFLYGLDLILDGIERRVTTAR